MEELMTKTLGHSAVRTRRRPADKFEDRREQLAAAALATLAEQGYARTSLRDIADKSQFTHGVLHYYFQDKTELITYCVQHYKARCIARYDSVVGAGTTEDDVRQLFCDAMIVSLIDDAPVQRLWYDLRSQSMFDAELAQKVAELDRNLEAMIFRVVEHFAELGDRKLTMSSAMIYALFDGIFQHAVLNERSAPSDGSELRTAIVELLECVAVAP
ncbi:TetR/AcrR family transcriptional regulator [Rhodococcus spongiicola]|uniref:TetR/AcrR family transcriptional regulator n=2 Tax=Rhodococcus spongiicola TaxID=2487352 RepID=A0A3S3AJD8_9NOCA|nr:TetR/AcrR family transcriptional regulator [Rhodococcus spongiicola]